MEKLHLWGKYIYNVKYLLLIITVVPTLIFLFFAGQVAVLRMFTPPPSHCGMESMAAMFSLIICIILLPWNIWLWKKTITRFRKD